MNQIKHIYFDLDNTLWDFSGNSAKILKKMFLHFKLHTMGLNDYEKFVMQYRYRNENLWEQYRLGNVSKEQVRLNRFIYTLKDFQVENAALAMQLADYYVLHTRQQTTLLPHAEQTLSYLFSKYQLHIITNGFDEVQYYKLNNSGIMKYFKTVTTAEEAQCLKPDKKIFTKALAKLHAKPDQSFYVGDSIEADAKGASAAGMHFILFDPELKEKQSEKINFKYIKSLKELMDIF